MISVIKSRQDGTTIKVNNYKDYQVFYEDEKDNELHNGEDNGTDNESASKAHKQDLKDPEYPKEPEEPEDIIKPSSSAMPTQKPKREKKSASSPPKEKPSYPADSVEYQATLYLINAIKAKNPNARLPDDENKIQNWCHKANLILRIDNKPIDEFKRVLKFATADSFWSTNILSMDKFREKYDQLYAKMQLNNKPAFKDQDVKNQQLTGIEKLRQRMTEGKGMNP